MDLPPVIQLKFDRSASFRDKDYVWRKTSIIADVFQRKPIFCG
jgi:hypothetical protein